jgi:IclR family transcriptional regulator, acetate operon repressor
VRKTSGLESVDNALRLLLLLAQEEAVRVSDVAHHLEVAPSSAHRLLATFRERGFVEQRPDRRYGPGPALDRLAGREPPAATLEQHAERHLVALRDALQETVHLQVLEGSHVLFLASAEADTSLRVGSRVGVRLPAHVTSGGKAILAAMSPPELREWFAGPGATLGLSGEEVERLRRQLAGVRRAGFGLNKSESERGIAAVGVAVRGAAGEPIGALTVSMPTVRLNHGRLGELAGALHRAREALETGVRAAA